MVKIIVSFVIFSNFLVSCGSSQSNKSQVTSETPKKPDPSEKHSVESMSERQKNILTGLKSKNIEIIESTLEKMHPADLHPIVQDRIAEMLITGDDVTFALVEEFLESVPFSKNKNKNPFTFRIFSYLEKHLDPNLPSNKLERIFLAFQFHFDVNTPSMQAKISEFLVHPNSGVRALAAVNIPRKNYYTKGILNPLVRFLYDDNVYSQAEGLDALTKARHKPNGFIFYKRLVYLLNKEDVNRNVRGLIKKLINPGFFPEEDKIAQKHLFPLLKQAGFDPFSFIKNQREKRRIYVEPISDSEIQEMINQRIRNMCDN